MPHVGIIVDFTMANITESERTKPGYLTEQEIRLKTRARVLELMVAVEVGIRARPEETGGPSAGSKRAADAVQTPAPKKRANAGVPSYFSLAGASSSAASARLSPEQVAQAELAKYLMDAERITQDVVPAMDVGLWWALNGRYFPLLHVVAEAVLSHVTSSAEIERDFGIASMILPSVRNALDDAYFQAQLLTKCNYDFLPSFKDMPAIRMTIPQVTAQLPPAGFGVDLISGPGGNDDQDPVEPPTFDIDEYGYPEDCGWPEL
jgi:hAT family C-terminal dimerisation region